MRIKGEEKGKMWESNINKIKFKKRKEISGKKGEQEEGRGESNLSVPVGMQVNCGPLSISIPVRPICLLCDMLQSFFIEPSVSLLLLLSLLSVILSPSSNSSVVEPNQ